MVNSDSNSVLIWGGRDAQGVRIDGKIFSLTTMKWTQNFALPENFANHDRLGVTVFDGVLSVFGGMQALGSNGYKAYQDSVIIRF